LVILVRSLLVPVVMLVALPLAECQRTVDAVVCV
jgi:hypothetical protein